MTPTAVNTVPAQTLPPAGGVGASQGDGQAAAPQGDGRAAGSICGGARHRSPAVEAGTGGGSQAAAVLGAAVTDRPPLHAADTPEKIHASFESAALKSLPVSSLEKIFAERGGFDRADIGTLRALDVFLQNRGAIIDPASPAQIERFEQWLRIALENPRLAEDLAQRLPIMDAGGIAERLRLLETLGAGLLPKDLAGEIPATGRILAEAGGNAGFAAKLLEELCQKTFSDAPAKLLEIIRLLDGGHAHTNTGGANTGEANIGGANTGGAMAGGGAAVLTTGSAAVLTTGGTVLTTEGAGLLSPQLQLTDARAILGEILNRMAEQIWAKPETLHDARLISPKNADAVIAPAREIPKNANTGMPPIPKTPDAATVSIQKTDSHHAGAAAPERPPPAGGSHPLPPNIYNRIISEPGFSVSAEIKNAVLPQINAAREAIRQAIEIRTGGNPPPAPPDNKNTGQPPRIDTAQISARPATGAGTERNPHVSPYNKDKGSPPQTDTAREPSTASGRPASPSSPTSQTATGNQSPAAANTASNAHRPAETHSQTTPPHPAGTHRPAETHSQTTPLHPAATHRPAETHSQTTPLHPAGTHRPAETHSQTTPPHPAGVHRSVEVHRPVGSDDAARVIIAQIDRLQAGFRSAFSSLELHGRVSPLDFSGDSVSLAIRQSFDSLRMEILLDASRALQEVFSAIDELRAAAGLFAGAGRAPSDAESAMFRAAEPLARQARAGGDALTEALQGILRELGRAQAESMREDGQAFARATPAEVMRAHARSAAGGLENLQLLAAQTRGPENTQQQVFALPVKMGQEWTEVQIKFIRERRKNKKNESGGRVSVYLNTAPSNLGEVTAHLDFHPPANLKLSFRFEKPEATKWFKGQANKLREALSEAGLPNTALEFHSKRPVHKKDAGVNDVKVTSVRSDGKLDLKV